MPLIKQQKGLLEQDNFYLTSSFSDFLGSAQYGRNDHYFELKRGEIKRHFIYDEFVIDVKKEPKILDKKDKHSFFIETSLGQIGLEELTGTEQITNWRILCYDRFMQVYESIDDGETWINKGGYKLKEDEKILYQGFRQEGESFLKFTEYKVYGSPFLYLQNFSKGFKSILYDEEHQELEQMVFNDNMTAQIFLDKPIKGYVKIYDTTSDLVCTSRIEKFDIGDRYAFTPYELEVVYEGNTLEYGPTYLGDIEVTRMKLVNKSKEIYPNITLLLTNVQVDVVQLSFDGNNYFDDIKVEKLDAGEEKIFYIKIIKKFTNEFIVREFELKII